MIEATTITRIGTSDVYVLPVQQYVASVDPGGRWGRIRIPVPPSANDWLKIGVRRFSRGGMAGMSFRPTPYMRLTDEARSYYANALPLRMAWTRLRATPISSYTKVRFYFFLANMRYDSHNGLKLACDLIEKSGLVVNDNMILPEVMEPVKAKEDPRLLIEFPLE